MPRRARIESSSGIHHVILRGVNRQRIFEDEEDNLKFLEIIALYKDECGFELLGYCLMGNHVHMLIKADGQPLGGIMKRITCKFVYWYNAKYDRIGHLFQDRYRSEPVEDDAHLLTVLRYIHRNPVKAGMAKRPAEYRFSSYRDYAEGGGICDTSLVLGMMPVAELVRFTDQDSDDACLEVQVTPSRRLTDEDAKAVMHEICGCSSAADFQSLDCGERRAAIGRLVDSGLSIRQANRLTGESIGVVRGCVKRARNEQAR